MSERLTKKQLKEDRFLEVVQSALAYARDNVLVVLAGLAVFVAAVTLAVRIGGSATGGGGGGGNPEAERALSEARTEFATGQFDRGRAALEEVRTRHRGSRAAREATYILANAYYEAGDWAQARATFEEFLKKPLYDELMKDGARLGIAACQEESGDLPGALASYRELWTQASQPGARIEAGLSAARVAAALGRVDEARALYGEVATAYPDSPEGAEAEYRKLELERGAAPAS